MKTIRILQVISSLKCGAGDITVLMNYYRNIDRERIQFDFLYLEEVEKDHKEEIHLLGGNTYKIRKPNITNLTSYRNEMTNYLDKHKLDYRIVHFHELLLFSLIAPVLYKRGTQQIIAHSHSVKYSYSKIKSLRNYIFCIPIRKLTKHYCSCSSASGEFWFGKENVREGKVKIINNAIDCNQFKFNDTIRKEIRKKLAVENKFVIGNVGRFSKEKNQGFLIDIFNELIKTNPNSILMLVGDGSMMNNIKRKVDDLKLSSKVMFLGQRADVNKLYQAMDVFVFPSISEGLGMACIEAQASGLPCVVSDSITKEIEIGKVEFLSLKEQYKEWARVILEIDTLRINMEIKIQNKGFNIKNEAKKLLNYYEELLEYNG